MEDKKYNKLTVHHPQKLSFAGKTGYYEVLGGLSMDLGDLKVSIHITELSTQKKHRLKVNLYDSSYVQNICIELSEKEKFNANELETDFLELTEELEKYRNEIFDKEMGLVKEEDSFKKELTPQAEKDATEVLKQKNLLQVVDSLIEKAGIIGEEKNRITLFLIASSYKMRNPLHALVQGTSGSGKSHMINTITECLPTEDVFDITRASSKAFYHLGDNDLLNKLMVIQDYDGLDKDSEFVLRELQSAKYVNSSVSKTDRFGETKAAQKKVNANFASLMATTKAEISFDNMSRSICLSIDESVEQTSKIVEFDNKRLTGINTKEAETIAKQQLRNLVRVLKSFDVVNPYADKIHLPAEAKMLRRLNNQFQNFIAQITILHQFQRKTDKQGRLVVTKEDIKLAIDIFFSSIILKVDDLDGSTRQFYDGLKACIEKGSIIKIFTPKDLRSVMNLEKTRVFEQLKTLQEMEYVKIIGGSQNRGFQYQLTTWDYMQGKKEKIKANLHEQLNKL
jgi:energy-coupling factor transporter ATP-binding protein EcfA2